MQINYKIAAVETIADVMNFVESKNTLGSGTRWLNKFETFLQNSLTKPSAIKPCNNRAFYKLGLRCLNFNDWVIAFSIEIDEILIEAVVHSSRIVD